MSGRTRLGSAVWGLAVGAAVLGAAGAASAQQIIRRENPQEWTLDVTVNLRAYQRIDPATKMPATDAWKFDSAAVVFPMIPESASHRLKVAESGGVLLLEDRPIDETVTVLPTTYHSGARLGRWEIASDWTGQEVELRVRLLATSWSTVMDEEAAAAATWPSHEWPAIAKSTFEPQMYVDVGPDGQPYDMKPVDEFLRRATDGKDPRSVPPLVLAKYLAGEVWEAFQPSGQGLAFARTGELEGIDLQGAPETVRRRRGSDYDIVTVLVALYRRAGLPARIVVGWDSGEESAKNFLVDRKGRRGLRVWAEFALWNERRGEVEWVPVDVIRLRRSSSRAKPLDQPWEYFGTHKELSGVVPFAFHFHPPTTVRAYGSPAFWGWLVLPSPPERADQAVRFMVMKTPKRGGAEMMEEDRPRRR